MEGMGLTILLPRQGIPHYGDWRAGLSPARWRTTSIIKTARRQGYGFLGGNVVVLRDDETVLGDSFTA